MTLLYCQPAVKMQYLRRMLRPMLNANFPFVLLLPRGSLTR